MKATLILSKIKVHDRNAARAASTADFEDMANSLEAVMTFRSDLLAVSSSSSSNSSSSSSSSRSQTNLATMR